MTSKSTRFVPSIRLAQYDVVNKQGDDMGQEDQDLELLDRYYTSYEYESYIGIVQKKIIKLGDHKPDAKFEINKDVAGEFRFNLVATNGEIIAVSQGYNAKESAMKGIESVKQNAVDAVIEDNTVLVHSS